MKKLTLFFAALLSVTVLFTACPPEPVNPTTASTPMKYWDGMFYSNHVDTDNNHPYGEYSLIFMTNTLDADATGNFSGEGKCFFLNVIAPNATSSKIEGTFPVVSYDGSAAPTQDMLVAGYQYDALADYGMPGVYVMDKGTYLYDITATDTTVKYVVGGELTIAYEGTVAKVTLKATMADADGANKVEEVYSYEGELSVGDYEWPEPFDPYSYEDEEVVNKTIVMTQSEMSYNSDYSSWVIKASNDENYTIGLQFFSDNSTDPTGTYTVSDSQENGTLLASSGGTEQGSLYYSIIGTLDAEGYIEDVWFVAGGSLTVTGTNYTGTLTSKKGSTFEISYTADETTEAPAYAPRANRLPVAKKANVATSLFNGPMNLK